MGTTHLHVKIAQVTLELKIRGIVAVGDGVKPLLHVHFHWKVWIRRVVSDIIEGVNLQRASQSLQGGVLDVVIQRNGVVAIQNLLVRVVSVCLELTQSSNRVSRQSKQNPSKAEEHRKKWAPLETRLPQ